MSQALLAWFRQRWQLDVVFLETEKQYKSDLGNVVIDVIIHSENETFFIEPYYSNPISDEKKKKLIKIKRVKTFGFNPCAYRITIRCFD